MESFSETDPSNFSRSIYEIVQTVSDAQKTGKINSYIENICSDMNLFVEESKQQALTFSKVFGGEGFPVFVLFSKAGNGSIFPIILDSIPQNDQERMQFAIPISLAVISAPIEAYCFFCQAWVAMYDNNDTRMPSQRPDKKEIMMVISHTPDTSVFKMYDIIRENDKDIIDLKLSPELNDMEHQAINILMDNFYKKAEIFSKIINI